MERWIECVGFRGSGRLDRWGGGQMAGGSSRGRGVRVDGVGGTSIGSGVGGAEGWIGLGGGHNTRCNSTQASADWAQFD
jgi:hypothetical protein